MSLLVSAAHGGLRELVVHARIQAKAAGLELGERLLLREQSRRDVRAVAGADV